MPRRPRRRDPRRHFATYVRTRTWDDSVVPALAAITGSIGDQIKTRGSLAQVPAEAVSNVRNDMYLTSEAMRLLAKDPHASALDAEARANLIAFRKDIDDGDQIHPAVGQGGGRDRLGLGTMVGWKRIVVTIGRRSARRT